MNKITNYILGWFFRKEIQNNKNNPNLLKIETEAIKTNCIMEILNEIEDLWHSAQKLKYKLGVKTVQNNSARIERDSHAKQTTKPNPVFTESQIAEIKKKYRRHQIIIIFFCSCESFLYFLTASLFVPGGGLVMQIPVAVFIAVCIMMALEYAFEKHFLYREVAEKHGRKELLDPELKKFKDLRNIYSRFLLTYCCLLNW